MKNNSIENYIALRDILIKGSFDLDEFNVFKSFIIDNIDEINCNLKSSCPYNAFKGGTSSQYVVECEKQNKTIYISASGKPHIDENCPYKKVKEDIEIIKEPNKEHQRIKRKPTI